MTRLRMSYTAKSRKELIEKILGSEPPSIRTLNSELAPELEELVKRLMARDPAERFQNARELLARIRELKAKPEVMGPVVTKAILCSEIMDEDQPLTHDGDSPEGTDCEVHDSLFRKCASRLSGIETRKGEQEFVASFERSSEAVKCALAFQRELNGLGGNESIQVRTGIDLAEHIPMAESERGDEQDRLIDLVLAKTASVMRLGVGGQILMTRAAFDSARQEDGSIPDGVEYRWLAHGIYKVEGIEEPLEIFEVGIPGLSPLKPPDDSGEVQRFVAFGEEKTLGWRPAVGLAIPRREDWTLERKLGEGGFGEVWIARQEETEQTRTFKFCFNAERLRALKREMTLLRLMKQVLGERPDIVRLHDVRLDEAPFYLEMDYSAGGDLAEWAGKRGGIQTVALQTRLELIAQVARALAAAHSVGVIHKDVKPTNVLIEERPDGSTQARLTDFGIGQLASLEILQEAGVAAEGFTTMASTVLTELDSPTGTRLYMAPELLVGTGPSIQSDVYALGILLYQVIIGDLSRPLAQGWDREIEDELLREDIAACVEGDPGRRLVSTVELADRLESLDERHARRQEEHRKSIQVERVRRRHRLLAIGSVLGLLVLVLVSIVALREIHLRRRADAEAKRANEVLGFLVDQFKIYEPNQAKGGMVTTKEVLDQTTKRIQTELTDQPLVQAKLMLTISGIYYSLGRSNKALPLAEEALRIRRELLGDEHIEVARSLNALGAVMGCKGDLEQAESLFRQALAIQRKILGDENLKVAVGLGNLGLLMQAKGDFEQAESFSRQALAIRRKVSGDEHPDSAGILDDLGLLMYKKGDLEQAESLFRQALAIQRKAYDDEHIDVALNLYNLGHVMKDKGDLEQAASLYHQSLESHRKLFGEESIHTAKILDDLGRVMQEKGDLDQAESFYRQALEIRRKVLGDEHKSVSENLSLLADWMQSKGNLEEADRLRTEVENIRQKIHAENKQPAPIN